MSGTLVRPVVGSRDRYPLAVDAFLYAAVIFLIGMGLQLLAASVVSGGTPDATIIPPWVEALGTVSMLASVVGGPLVAWRVHGRTLHGRDLLGVIVGVAVGGVLLILVFFALMSLWRFVPAMVPRDEVGPVDGAIVLAVVVLAFLAKPVISVSRDVAGPREHVLRDWLRLGAPGVALAAVVVSIMLGGEGAELGAFMVPSAAAAACAVTGISQRVEGRRRHRAFRVGSVGASRQHQGRLPRPLD